MSHSKDCKSRTCPGCGHESEMAKLKRRIEQLEKENRELKQQVKELGK